MLRKLLLWAFGVRVLPIREGDVLLVELDYELPTDSIDSIQSYLSDALGFRVPIVYCTRGERTSVLRGLPSQAEANSA